MKILTQEQIQKMLANGKANINGELDLAPVVKLYIPNTKAVWLLSELMPDAPYIAFGLCDLGVGFPELGYVDLAELLSLNSYPVMQDYNFAGIHPISYYADLASKHQQIIA